MKKVYEKAEVKVYELELELSVLVGTSGETLGPDNEGDYEQP